MTIPQLLLDLLRSIFFGDPPGPKRIDDDPPTVGLENYRHEVGTCRTRPYGHHTAPKFCGDPRCAK